MPRARRLLIAGACLLASTGVAQSPPRASLTDGERVVQRADSFWSVAVARGTRSSDGTPGPRHWVQGARYALRATVDPARRTLRGDGLLRYRNRSPDTLRTIAFELAQNLLRPGAPHNEMVPVTGGLELDQLCIARLARAPAAALCASDGADDVTRALRVNYTVATLTLPVPLAPGDSLDVAARWHFDIPTEDAPRMGSDGSVTLMAYWYPRFRVYDDVAGWQLDPYLATGEFYMDHADYDVQITVPSGILVAATGALQNAAEVLPAGVRARLARARQGVGGDVVHVVTDSLRRAGGATLPGTALTWHFTADSVRDVAFYTSREVVWDAIAAIVPRGAGRDTVLVHALYRTRARGWNRAADYGRQSLEHFSRTLWAYPWPQLSLVEGVVDGGMEYPMLTAVSVGSESRELLTTIAHETGHMWFPMQVGSDERRFAWMDEGLASWMERSLLRASTGHDDDDEAGIPELYRMLTGTNTAPSMLVHADHYRGGLAYTAASYDKLVVVLRAFAAEQGDSALVQGLRAYGQRWSGRHPYPADFSRMVFAATGADRDRFVDDWVRGTGHFDVAIDGVSTERDTLVVSVRSRGGARLSVPVEIRRDDGRVERRTIAASEFRTSPVMRLRIARAGSVTSVTLDPASTRPDLDRTNQRWSP
ncbi:MAG: M1 family metallopeptidase [Gemmatimonadota bacterium]